MNEAAKRLLSRIGEDLRHDRYPRFQDGGFIVPGDEHLHSQPPGEENQIVRSRPPRPATRPRKRTAGWQRPTRSADPTSPIRIPGLEERLSAQIEAVGAAYPGVRVLHQEFGAWLVFTSQLLDGLSRKARFAVAVPFTTDRVKAWGFWEGALQPLHWIGPRHTNFPEGSVCAFNIFDPSPPGDHDLVGLFDIYTLWAARHLHQEVFGSWPGRHVGHFATERIFEFKSKELCGCGSEDLLYQDCCARGDSGLLSPKVLVDFILSFESRRVPAEVEAFMSGGEAPRIELLQPPEYSFSVVN